MVFGFIKLRTSQVKTTKRTPNSFTAWAQGHRAGAGGVYLPPPPLDIGTGTAVPLLPPLPSYNVVELGLNV